MTEKLREMGRFTALSTVDKKKRRRVSSRLRFFGVFAYAF
jgi:hypothetical protein